MAPTEPQVEPSKDGMANVSILRGTGSFPSNEILVHVDGSLETSKEKSRSTRLVIVFRWIDEALVWLFKRVPFFLLFGILTAAAISVYRMSLERKFRFSDIEVPAHFARVGYSGAYVARGIIDEMQRVRDAAATLTSMRQVRRKGEKELPPLNIQVQGQNIPLDALITSLWPGWTDSTLFVGGELVHSGSQARLTVRVGTTSKTFPFTTRVPAVPPRVFRDAAEFILQESEPYVLASSFMRLSPSRAESLFTVLTKAKDRRLRAQAFTGLVDLKQGDTTVPAETLLVLSRTADPSYPGSYADLAAVYNGRRRNDEALAILDSAPKGERGWDALAITNLSGILNDVGRFQESLEKAQQAMAMEDGFAPHYNAAKALIGLNRIEDAQIQFEHALTFAKGDPGEEGIRFSQAVALALLGRADAARELSAKVRRADSSLLVPTQMLDALLKGVDSVLRVDPSEGPKLRAGSMSNLGEWLSVVGRHDEARKLLDEASKIDSTTAIIQWRVARAACWRGDSMEARVRFERFRVLDESRNGIPIVRVRKRACVPPTTHGLHR